MPAKMKIKSAYTTLPAAERNVADFILSDPAAASLMTINEIAAASGVSVPSVTRLAKKLGYGGFMDFRVALASGNASIASLKSDPIRPTDTDDTVIDKMFVASMRAIEDTLKSVDKANLAILAERMLTASRVFVFASASGAFLAQDLVTQFIYMGIDAVAVSDPSVMQALNGRFTSRDVFIGISRSGRTKLLLDALRAARDCGAYTAFISNYINSPATNIADCFFCTSRVDDMKTIMGRESNLSMMTLFGTLVILMARKNGGVKVQL